MGATMTSYRINFTKAALLKADPAEKGKRDYYNDLRDKGLQLSVTDKGGKSFYLYRKLNGKPERIRLGPFPDMTIEQARKKSAEHKGDIAKGKNPQEERRAIRAEMTFKELFDKYMSDYSKLHKKSWEHDQREVKKHLPHLYSRKISTITKMELQRYHKKMGELNGIYAANRTLERVRAILNKAIEWGWTGTNPASGIKKFKEKSRDRFLSADELPRFFKAVSEEENTAARDYILISLLTGARKANVLSMAWSDISLTDKIWRIPETKNGESQIIPLSPQVIEILKERHKEKEKEKEKENDFVFPGKGKTKHLADPKKAWKRILESAKITDLRIHDLRRTMGSWQAATGANSYIIWKSLGLKSPQSTAVYARLNIDPVRDSMNRATDAMMNLMGNTDDE